MADDSMRDVDDIHHDWLKQRHERLMMEMMELLSFVPPQGKDDDVEELIARVRWVTQHLRAQQESKVPPRRSE